MRTIISNPSLSCSSLKFNFLFRPSFFIKQFPQKLRIHHHRNQIDHHHLIVICTPHHMLAQPGGFGVLRMLLRVYLWAPHTISSGSVGARSGERRKTPTQRVEMNKWKTRRRNSVFPVIFLNGLQLYSSVCECLRQGAVSVLPALLIQLQLAWR